MKDSILETSKKHKKYWGRCKYRQSRRGKKLPRQSMTTERNKKSVVNYKSINRFIRSNIGKKWDVVYSSICNNFPHNIYHIKNQVLSSIISISTEYRSGVLYDKEKNCKVNKNYNKNINEYDPSKYANTNFYVDPYSGMIKKV